MSGGKRRRTGDATAGTVPLVLLVGCPADFVAACREAGTRFSVGVRECEMGSMRAAASSARPFAVIVTEVSYQMDPGEFDAVARQLDASLLRLEAEDVRRRDVGVLVDAVFESAASTDVSGVRPALC